jgi:hypothetical protein
LLLLLRPGGGRGPVEKGVALLPFSYNGAGNGGALLFFW